jgi:hypothetical protein
MLWLLVAAIAASGWPAFGVGQDEAVIRLERRHGGGFSQGEATDLRQSPGYTIDIFADGTVVYEGTWGVSVVGRRSHTIPRQVVAALVDEFLAAGFLGFSTRYDGVRSEQRSWSIDHGADVTLTFRHGGLSRSVEDHYGTPAVIRQLERRVDEVAESWLYTGRRVAPAQTVRLSGRVTGEGDRPLAGVTVRVLGGLTYSVRTGEDGSYAADVERGRYVLSVRHDDYQTMEKDLELLDPTRPVEAHFGLTPRVADPFNETERQLIAITGRRLSKCASAPGLGDYWLQLVEHCFSQVTLESGRWSLVQTAKDPWRAAGLIKLPSGVVLRFTSDGRTVKVESCHSPKIGADAAGVRLVCG